MNILSGMEIFVCHLFMSYSVPPNIKGEEVNATVMLGGPVELHCHSDAVPPPTLLWRKDGRPLFRKPGLTVSADGSLFKVESVRVSAQMQLENIAIILCFVGSLCDRLAPSSAKLRNRKKIYTLFYKCQPTLKTRVCIYTVCSITFSPQKM